jgi:hypothetical protein
MLLTALLHWRHVHSPHPHHRFQRPGSLALANLVRTVGPRLTHRHACLNEPQHTLLPAAPTPRWVSFELKELFHDFRTRI